jgi:hypothetical protein
MKVKNKAYRFTTEDQEWVIVAADNKLSAQFYYMKEFGLSEKEYDKANIKITKVSPKERCRVPFFEKGTTIGYVLNVIKFFPRIISDSDDMYNWDCK